MLVPICCTDAFSDFEELTVRSADNFLRPMLVNLRQFSAYIYFFHRMNTHFLVVAFCLSSILLTAKFLFDAYYPDAKVAAFPTLLEWRNVANR